MSPGVAVFVGVLGAAALFIVIQLWMVRRSRALLGRSPTLPGDWQHLSEGTHLVWFHSPTCGPCRAMEPELTDLVQRGNAVEINILEHPELSRQLGVMATPTTVVLHDGEVVEVEVGVRNRSQLQALFSRATP